MSQAAWELRIRWTEQDRMTSPLKKQGDTLLLSSLEECRASVSGLRDKWSKAPEINFYEASAHGPSGEVVQLLGGELAQAT